MLEVLENEAIAIDGDGRTFIAKLVAGEYENTKFNKIELISDSTTNSSLPDIGSACSARIEVSMPSDYNISADIELQLLMMIKDGSWHSLGYYTPQKPSTKDGTTTFTAYDRMASRCSGDYLSKLTLPCDIYDVCVEIEEQTGINIKNKPKGIQISQITDDDGIQVSYDNPFKGCTHREAIGYIAGAIGKFAIFNYDGDLEFRWYTSVDYSIKTNMSYGDIDIAEDIFAVDYLSCTIADDITIESGEGATGISFSNPIVNQTIVDNLFKGMKGFSFYPTTLSFKGDFRLELGDIVTIYMLDGTTYEVPIMHIKHTFDGGLATQIASYGSTEQSAATYKSPLMRELQRFRVSLSDVDKGLAAKIEATEESIITEVNKSYTTKEEFNNLEIGGRNLAKNSSTVIKYININANSGSVSDVLEDITVPSGFYRVFTSNNIGTTSAYTGVYFNSITNFDIEDKMIDGETYTISCYAKADTDNVTLASVGLIGWPRLTPILNHGGGNSGDKLSTTWRQYYITGIYDSSKTSNITIYAQNPPAGSNIYFSSFKIEKGTKATDWTLAPEDVEADIAQVKSIAEQTAEGFSWLVADDYSESNITLSKDAYDVIADNITLKGEHIQLDGDTTVGEGFKLTANNMQMGNINNYAQLNDDTYIGLGFSTKNEDGYYIKTFPYVYDAYAGNVLYLSNAYNEVISAGDTYKLKLDYDIELFDGKSITSIKDMDYIEVAPMITTLKESTNESTIWFNKISDGEYLAVCNSSTDKPYIRFSFRFKRTNSLPDYAYINVKIKNVVITKATNGSDIQGVITSANYEENADGNIISGMRTDYINGKIKSKYLKVDENGAYINGSAYFNGEFEVNRPLINGPSGNMVIKGGSEGVTIGLDVIGAVDGELHLPRSLIIMDEGGMHLQSAYKILIESGIENVKADVNINGNITIGNILEVNNYIEALKGNSRFNAIVTGERIGATDTGNPGAFIGNYGAMHLSRTDGNNPYYALYKNGNGGSISYDGTNMIFSKPITAPNIGQYKSETSSSTNISSSTNCTNTQSLSLDAGVWIVQFWATWGGNSSGRRHINISNTSASSSSNGSVADIRYPGGTGSFPQSKITLLNVSSPTTFYINAGQNSGSTLTCTTGYRAVRIK